MIVTPIKTDRITPNSIDLLELLGQSLDELAEASVLVVTSKIVSLCEGSVVPGDQDREALIKQHADLWLPKTLSKYGQHFTIVDNSLIGSAGIDTSNGDGMHILWPKDAQSTANQIRAYLKKRFGLQHVGVIISDSTSQPLRRGVTGIALAFSGFYGLNSYIGQPDLFGSIMQHSSSNVVVGLVASAVFTMGEGREQTPLCVVSDAPLIRFNNNDPTARELADYFVSMQDDLFAPFWEAMDWQAGH